MILRKHACKKNVIIFAGSLICALFLWSCGSEKNSQNLQNLNEIPVWYINAKNFDGTFLYGTGEGGSLSVAIKVALNDAASKLRTDVSSTTTTSTMANDNFASTSLNQKIKSSVEKITFNNYEKSNVATLGDKIYVEVKINKMQMLSEKQTELNDVVSKINAIYARGGGFSNLLEKRSEYKKIADLLLKLKSNAYLLYVLSGGAFNLKENLEIASNFENNYAKIITQIVFKIEPCEAKKAISQILNRAGMRTSENASGENAVFVKCSQSSSTSQIYGKFYVKNNLQIAFEADGKEIHSKTIVFSGSSSISYPEAVKNSYQNLVEGIVAESEGEGTKSASKSAYGTLDDDSEAAYKILGL